MKAVIYARYSSDNQREFIEMCFDPQAPVNKRLKEALLRIMTEEANEE